MQPLARAILRLHPYPRTMKHTYIRHCRDQYTQHNQAKPPKLPAGSLLERKKKRRATIIQSLSKGETAHGSWCHGPSPSIRGKITTSQDVPSGAYPEFTPKNGSSPRFSFRGVHVGCRISPNPPPPSRSHERI